MAIPNYQEFMNPVLKAYASGEILKKADILKNVMNDLNIPEQDLNEVIKSGESTISNRTQWAIEFMYMAGLLERTQRGFYKITPEGLRVYNSGVQITDDFLMQYDSFVEFMDKSKSTNKPKQRQKDTDQTCSMNIDDPEQRISDAIDEMNAVLESEILASLKTIDPKRFEQIVVDLMKAMDYGVGETTRYVADGGIDGVINEDELGLSKIYLQAKRYNDNKVNELEMRNFIGALATNNVTKGVFVTTSEFAEKARVAAEKAHGHTIVLVDGKELARLMRLHNLGAKPKKNYDIKEFDSSYFEE